jgi:hypothetical protein
MSLLLQLALAIGSTNHALPPRKVRELAAVVVEQASQGQLDPWLIYEIVYRESRWTPSALRREWDGTCSVGLGQINTRCDKGFIAPLFDPVVNLRKIGEYLVHFRKTCSHECENGMWLRGYNPGSSTYAPEILAKVSKHHHPRASARQR